jgi:hypothetical protein
VFASKCVCRPPGVASSRCAVQGAVFPQSTGCALCHNLWAVVTVSMTSFVTSDDAGHQGPLPLRAVQGAASLAQGRCCASVSTSDLFHLCCCITSEMYAGHQGSLPPRVVQGAASLAQGRCHQVILHTSKRWVACGSNWVSVEPTNLIRW